MLDAETEGQLGFILELELANALRDAPGARQAAALLTQVRRGGREGSQLAAGRALHEGALSRCRPPPLQVVVDPADPAFARPTKQVGPRYSRQEAEALAADKGWSVAPDGDSFRRVVASPLPHDVVEWRAIQLLLEVCGGVGGADEAWGRSSGAAAACLERLCKRAQACPAAPPGPTRRRASSWCAAGAGASPWPWTGGAGSGTVWRRWWTRTRVGGPLLPTAAACTLPAPGACVRLPRGALTDGPRLPIAPACSVGAAGHQVTCRLAADADRWGGAVGRRLLGALVALQAAHLPGCTGSRLHTFQPPVRRLPVGCAADAGAIYDPAAWPKEERPLASPVRCSQLQGMSFASGSMAPKVAAACRFATATGGRAAVGNIADALAIVQGKAGTVIVAG